MSDFTKDELQIILLDMNTYIEKNRSLKESPSHGALRLKIQSMIDDYCEREKNEQKRLSAEEFIFGKGK